MPEEFQYFRRISGYVEARRAEKGERVVTSTSRILCCGGEWIVKENGTVRVMLDWQFREQYEPMGRAACEAVQG